jgi:DNA-binding CsgD family transcriptional regulator
MREVTLAIPLFDSPLTDGIGLHFLAELLKRVTATYFFRIRGEGFLMICRAPSKQSEAFRKSNTASRFRSVHVKVLNTEKSGEEILQVSGTWRELTPHSSKITKFMKSVGKKRVYITRNPSFDRRGLQVSLAADEEVIKELLQEMKSADIPFGVASLSPSKAREESPLGDLTEKQAEVLRLAYSRGYYSLPKKVGIEEIARLLGKDKGTVGEHLRRAEKHVFDRLLS